MALKVRWYVSEQVTNIYQYNKWNLVHNLQVFAQLVLIWTVGINEGNVKYCQDQHDWQLNEWILEQEQTDQDEYKPFTNKNSWIANAFKVWIEPFNCCSKFFHKFFILDLFLVLWIETNNEAGKREQKYSQNDSNYEINYCPWVLFVINSILKH